MLPSVGDVYETTLASATVLLCIRVREIKVLEGFAFDFLVLDGGPPEIRIWASYVLAEASMESTMHRFKFKKLA